MFESGNSYEWTGLNAGLLNTVNSPLNDVMNIVLKQMTGDLDSNSSSYLKNGEYCSSNLLDTEVNVVVVILF